MRITTILVSICLASFAAAQDRAGNNTPGEWIVDHQKPFGLWDSFCDYRVTGEMREERCYLRYVDVFSKRPKFAAMFAFVTPGPIVDFGLEAGTIFRDGGFRIERNGYIVWADPKAGCLVGLKCTWEGAEAETLLQELSKGGQLAFDFHDRHGQPTQRQWDLSHFAEALEDYRTQAATRGLLGS